MKIDLAGKSIVLTGAAGFFGKTFANQLLESGADHVVLIDVSEAGLASLSQLLSQKYAEDKFSVYCLDQSNHAAANKTYSEIVTKHDVDGVINNAFSFSKDTGFNSPDGRLLEATYEQMLNSFESGIYWAVQATQVFGKAMQEKGGGTIVNVCSMYAVVVPSPDLYEGTEKFNPPGYSMGKAGLLQFTRYAASFLSPSVRVNAISPGAIPNLGGDSYNSITSEDPVLKRLHQKILLKRMGTPEDLTGAIVYLLSDASSYVTGQNIIIDGGLTVT